MLLMNCVRWMYTDVMEPMETAAFIPAPQTAKTGDAIPIQASVLVVFQDIRVQNVTMIVMKEDMECIVSITAAAIVERNSIVIISTGHV